MVNDVRRIKTELENTYDIPFYVYEERVNGEPSYCMGPENSENEFFYIRVSFRNKIRVTAEFVPEKYGADFIRSMPSRTENDKDTFLGFLDLMQERGGKVTLIINHNSVLPENFKDYKGEWDNLIIKATKAPASDSDLFSYAEIAAEWGSLMMGMILSMADIVEMEDEESEQIPGYSEGKLTRVTTNKYERNPLNRKLCLEKRGYSCCICGMDFEQTYGDIGHHFIHVHHIVPVSQIGEGYIINPEKDLIPVCPNCHAMLHRKDPPYLPEELEVMVHPLYEEGIHLRKVAEDITYEKN